MNVAERVKQAGGATRLVARCLGRFRLEDSAGNPLHLRTRKARAALSALALSGGPMSRDALADLLWSDRGEAQARSSVRQTVFELQHLEAAGAPILSVGRDELALRRELVVTDLELIRRAAEESDWPRLLTLLERSEPGLLTDLDGLDLEFDSWLRAERAQEPSKTLSMALAAAEQCLAEAGARAASDLVCEILRLDPLNEEAARLALTVDHLLGDSGALHRHFHSLRDRLREDLDAEPSPETTALFRRLSARSDAPDERAAPRADPAPSTRREPEPTAAGRPKRSRPVLAAIALLVAAVAVLAGLMLRDRMAPSAAGQPLLLAVLPFEQRPAGNSFLADGLWDDTRAALSQHGAIRVLGRTTTEAMARSGAEPAEYRRRVGADFVLEGVLRRSGERVRVAVTLIRTSDARVAWSGTFAGRLGDPLALQQAIAQGIEGHLRGRLALGGGRRADQIATSPEVYALYSEARSLLRQRGSSQARSAEALLRRAVALDPNYAPAWSSLASSLYFRSYGPEQSAGRREEALRHARRALALAPNLAQAHATLAFTEGGNWPPAEQALKRAVELDPGDVEAWNWLGNVRASQLRRRAAVDAYRRAFEIDPLWPPTTYNLVNSLAELGDKAAVESVIARAVKAGADRELLLALRAAPALVRGDYSAAVGPLLRLRSERRERFSSVGGFTLGEGLIALGYFDELAQLWRVPDWVGPVLRSEMAPRDLIRGERVGPRDFWLMPFYPAFASRAMLNRGRGDELVSGYRRGFGSRDEFLSAILEESTRIAAAPNLAVALIQARDPVEADFLLQAIDAHVQAHLRNAPGDRDMLFALGRVRAIEGRPEEALGLVGRAIQRGWLPDGRLYPIDIAQDPPLWALRDDPRFNALRKRILDHIARERAELGPVKI